MTETALESADDRIRGWRSAAAAYSRAGNMAAAIGLCRHILIEDPADLGAHNDLGTALRMAGHLAEATRMFRRALTLVPDQPQINLNLARALLQQGQFAEGWVRYESRWKTPAFAAQRPSFPQPEWAGEALAGRTILLYGEQGFGDTIQFARFVPAVAARGGRVLLQVLPPLVRLLRDVPGVAGVTSLLDPPPPFDCHLALMSIPRVLGIEGPATATPYLRADPVVASAWRRRLAAVPGLKAGLVWAGDPRPDDRVHRPLPLRRSVPFSHLAPLATVSGLSLISVQVGRSDRDATPTADPPLFDATDELKDFADTAALIDALDLVITVDTAVAHLAGAMGKPVWILLRFDACWRWMQDRADSPWYPTARLFRQPHPGAWDDVIRNVAGALAAQIPHALTSPGPAATARPPTALDLFVRAVARHGAGEPGRAILLYRQVLTLKPDSAEVLTNLGIVWLALRHFAAVTLASRRAIAINPNLAQAHFNLGTAAAAQGRPAVALACFRNVIILAPDHPRAYYSLGGILKGQVRLAPAALALRRAIFVTPQFAEAFAELALIFFEQKRYDNALFALRQALARHPDFVDAIGNLALVLKALKRFADAEAVCRHALMLRPAFAEALNNQGILLSERNAHPQAAIIFRRALTVQPGYAEATSNLGNALQALNDVDAAIVCHRRALVLKPDGSQSFNNLGNSLRSQDRLEAAMTCYHRALRLNPADVESHSNLGNVLKEQGRYDEALVAYREALRHDPDAPVPHANYAMALLQRGRLDEGWKEYEWRKQTPEFRALRPPLDRPEWAGEPLNGRTLLLSSEQGFGDVLQFCRYAPVLAARGARVLLQVAPPLLRLLRTLPGAAASGPISIVAPGEPTPAFDFHLPMLSAPVRLGTTLDTIPMRIPYLFADPVAAAAWRERLSGFTGLKVGLVWAGDPRNHHREANLLDHRRSLALDRLAPLGAIPGLHLISLQKGQSAAQARTPPAGLVLLDWMDEIDDFADTAALIDALDLVITVDTSVAHLTGALGKPVWILSRYDGCWRWLLDRDDTPWYPTARLFRQRRSHDWDAVIEQVRIQLAGHTAS
ncbi:MAG: tetratricopeptide repeat protein [Azospirillaceae bacterium]|nr:tetratricopeptide repeat protein [Azospirillaceae bacterium]